MDTFSTLEEVKLGMQAGLFAEEQWDLRPEQRDAIDLAKDQFCKRSGTKGSYVWTPKQEYKQFLWNAKMRFGKTMCALQLAREMGVKRTIIVTHRPVVGANWEEDFNNVFGDKIKGNTSIRSKYSFGTLFDEEQHDKRKFYDLEKFVETDGNHYVFFVSMQFLRLSELVNAKTQAKNESKQDDPELFGHSASKENEKLKADILNTDWDLVVIDEAHEGTRTSLGKKVIDEFLHKKETKMLHLSGTPFNLYEDFGPNEVFNWDYTKEQSEKAKFYEEHPGEKNPYEELPRLNIATFDIRNIINNYLDQEGLFTFSEFFRTWTGNPKADLATMPDGAKGRFVHEEDVNRFLDLLCTKDDKNNFPFSTDAYRQSFRHTLWVVSHVDEAKALETLLNEHKTFKRFTIVNVAGKSEDDEKKEDALDKVLSAIGDLPEKTATITISCGRLTTGVTVRPWTAVLYMKGGDRPATYMQTIFRVQSPYITKDGAYVKQIMEGCKIKRDCYVFDFAPDRASKMVAGTAKFASMANSKESKKKNEDEEDDRTQDQKDRETLANFMKFCPMFSLEGALMSPLDVDTVFRQLNNALIDRLVRKGFDDPCLYNQDELNKLNPEILNHIGENGGQAPDEKRHDAKAIVDLSNMTPEQRAAWEENIRRKKAEAAEAARKKAEKDEKFKQQWDSWTEEQREEWKRQEAEKLAKREKAKEEREEFKKRMTNIRGISLRIPLLMYGGADAGEADDDITVDNFTRKIKDESWEEFMPKGITKEDFNKIKKVFNATRFFEAGKQYRVMTRNADHMHVDERIQQIAEIFSYFRNPDKETVLTPWRVVNMHMSDTLGGWCFYDESFDEKTGMLEHPRFVDQGDVTQHLFDNVDLSGEVQTKILEINSKTGLYPLYVTYSLYRRRLQEYINAECIDPATISVQEEQVVWDDIVTDNIFVICNTPMAVGITRRTLFGFRKVDQKANIKAEKLIERATTDREELIHDFKSVGFWKGNTSKKDMTFNAVIGNPPYQGDSSSQIYPVFYLTAIKTGKYVSMIFPTGWQKPCSPRAKGLYKMNNEEVKADPQIVYINCLHNVFPGVSGAAEVNIIFWEKDYNNGLAGSQLILQDGINPTATKLEWELDNADIPDEIRILGNIVKGNPNFKEFSPLVSSRSPYGLNTDAFKDMSKHGLPQIVDELPIQSDDIKVLGKGAIRYIRKEYPLPNRRDNIDNFKVFIPYAWGNMSESAGLGGAYGDIIIGHPNEICTQTYVVSGNFDSEEMAFKHAKYFMTQFMRALMFIHKNGRSSATTVYAAVPQQDYSEDWWNESIEKIDKHLFDKYKVPEEIREFVVDNIQKRTLVNIIK